MKRVLNIVLIVLLLICVTNFDMLAQCPMCKIAAESNLESGGTEAKGLNKGILYILMMPYILVSTLGFLWWKHNQQQDEERLKDNAIADLVDS